MLKNISSIRNLKNFKDLIFGGNIVKFNKSEISLKLINEIKKEIKNFYREDISHIHLNKNSENLSKEIIRSLKNNSNFLNLFIKFLEDIGFDITDCYRDKFVVRIAPAKLARANYEASRIGIHRDTWGTNIFQQINWWAPINTIDKTNTLVFYPDYFNKPIKNTTDTWDLNTYFRKRKTGEFDYPSAPQLKEELETNTKVLNINIEPGEVLCFSGSHLHSSSKKDSKISRFSYEIRTVSYSDIDNNLKAPNIDCELKKQYTKIFRHFSDNRTLEITR